MSFFLLLVRDFFLNVLKQTTRQKNRVFTKVRINARS